MFLYNGYVYTYMIVCAPVSLCICDVYVWEHLDVRVERFHQNHNEHTHTHAHGYIFIYILIYKYKCKPDQWRARELDTHFRTPSPGFMASHRYIRQSLLY